MRRLMILSVVSWFCIEWSLLAFVGNEQSRALAAVVDPGGNEQTRARA